MLVIGVPLGILIGVVSGVVFLLLFKTLWRASVKQIPLLIGEMLSIPTFWFGGHWLTTALLESVDLNEMLPSFILSLTCVFVPIAMASVIFVIVRYGTERGETERASNV